MKKLLLASVGVLALGVVSGHGRGSRSAPMPPSAPAYVAAGLQLDRLLCWHQRRRRLRPFDLTNAFGATGFNTSGGLVGGTLGYNYQIGQAVIGIEGDGDWSDIGGSTRAASAPAQAARCATTGSPPCAAGSATPIGRFMPYITGGAAFGDIKTSVAGFGGSTTDKAGWTAGGGVEATISGPWSAKLEYLYVDLGKAAAARWIAACRPTPASTAISCVSASIIGSERMHATCPRSAAPACAAPGTGLNLAGPGSASQHFAALHAAKHRGTKVLRRTLVAAKAGTCAAKRSCQATSLG